MLWIHLILLLINLILALGLYALIFRLLPKLFPFKSSLQYFFFLLFLAGLMFTTTTTVLPEVKRMLLTKSFVEKEIQKELHYAPAIKENAPKIYQNLVHDVFTLFKSRKDKEEGLFHIRLKFTHIMKKRLLKASDQTIIQYLKTALLEIKDLQNKNPNHCYDYLSQGYVKGISMSHVFSKETKQNKTKLITSILKTYNKEAKLPANDDVTQFTLPLYLKLLKSHDLKTILAIKQKSKNISQTKGCNVLKDLFTDLLKLNPKDTAKVARVLISAT